MAKHPPSSEGKPSKILLEELYATEDDGFLDCFVQFDSYPFLKQFSAQWMQDKRPWAREQLIGYLHRPLNFPGHEVVFKRTLKTAIEKEDIELLIHFLAVLDRLVRRKRTKGYTYDYKTRHYYQREYLFATPNKTVREERGRIHEYTYRKQTYRMPLPDILNSPKNRLFSQQTRAYLRRRIWRTFRHMAYQQPQRYVEAITAALALYENAYFDCGEAILDNWSLMHACYFHAPEIAFTHSHTNVVRGQSLATLKAAPYLPAVWQGEAAAQALWQLLATARSQFVRMWTIEMLREHHEHWLKNVSIEQLIQLLSSGDPTVGEFAVELFRQHQSLSRVEIPTWLRLLDEADFSVLPVICEAMHQHIDPSRLSDDQLIELTLARPAAIARLGLAWLKMRHRQHPLPAAQLCRLTAAGCEWEAAAIADWAIVELTQPERYSAEHLAEFFDSHSTAVRHSACRWLTATLIGDDVFSLAIFPADTPPQHDPRLWLKLIETPYDEVRFALLTLLGSVVDQSPQHLDATLSTGQYLTVLSAVVLCVDRGSRSKPKAIEQLASLAIREPSKADVVIPVLAIAARSIRGPEQAAGLSGLATLADRHPDLAVQLGEVLPEWNWDDHTPRAADGERSSR
ncbi:hypothetical protein [Blastopirellula marina]|uniref:Uncharacterized protein n=1 Tax=Blastopirellula marina TaxID=124 RepID=A0A2S8G982_9BACT|nr:hypothetical protein [Blastopirellula marina]PQO40831.1 hypothetical protein C5Y98_04440 [Blastopirellula marina]PTL45713.1 hypothetical protein C5Y97_04440 [Blastopirellula marina]